MTFDHTQTREFLKWLDSNPNGYVGAFRYGSYLKLHRARCHSLRKPTKQSDAVKFCDTERTAVEAWAAKQEPKLSPCKLSCCFPNS